MENGVFVHIYMTAIKSVVPWNTDKLTTFKALYIAPTVLLINIYTIRLSFNFTFLRKQCQ